MAILSIMIGGLTGFATFIASWLVVGTSFLTAMSLYVLVGIGVALTLIAVGLILNRVSVVTDARLADLPIEA